MKIKKQPSNALNIKSEAPSSEFKLNFSGITLSKISDKDRKKFYHAFEILLSAGIDIKNTLELLKTQNIGKVWKKHLNNIYQDVVNGQQLSEAFRNTQVFTEYEIASVTIGEETGFLNQIISQLHQHYNEKIKLRRLVVSTFSYPVMVLLMTTGTLYFMLTYIVPMFANIFKRFNRELPGLTQSIITISNWIGENGVWVILILFILLVSHIMLSKLNSYRMHMGNLILKIPLLGETVRKTYLSRFTMAMNFLIKSGTSLVQSIELSANMVGFYPLEKALRTVKKDLTNGESLADSFSKFSIFPPTFISLIRIAEDINKLDDMFEKIAFQFQSDLEHQTKVVSRILEPLLIMVVAAIVGVILIAMYLPLFNLSNVL
jgi:type IV pilus assembly protein PilC